MSRKIVIEEDGDQIPMIQIIAKWLSGDIISIDVPKGATVAKVLSLLSPEKNTVLFLDKVLPLNHEFHADTEVGILVRDGDRIPEYILNMTEGSFFGADTEENRDKILLTFFEKDNRGVSRWRRSDKIIFVPEHLRDYVESKYENIFPK